MPAAAARRRRSGARSNTDHSINALAALQTDTTASRDADDLPQGTLFAGVLLKRGSSAKSAFKERHVTLSRAELTYAHREGERAVGRVAMAEVIGIATGYSRTTSFLGTPMSCGSRRSRPQSTPMSKQCISDDSDDEESVSGRNALFWRQSGPLAKADKRVAYKFALQKEEIAIFCSKEGLYAGRVYVFKCNDQSTRERWFEMLSRVVISYSSVPLEPSSCFERIRYRVRGYYVSDFTQVTVAGLIMANFVANICESSVKPSHQSQQIFDGVDLVFTAIFTAELLVNMFATLVWEFVRDAWNWFDFIVVGISLVSLGFENLPGSDVLRLMRCFRVFRLFKRVPSLRKIMGALSQSMVPMANAFSIVCLVTAIYAIIGTNFFKQIHPENFGSFFISFFTLFQAMTGDNWSEHCRNLMSDSGMGVLVALYYVSFLLLVSLVLVNVVIAVLLDEFGKAADNEAASENVGQLIFEMPELDGLAFEDPFERFSHDLMVYGDVFQIDMATSELFNQIRLKGMVNAVSTSERISLRPIKLLKTYFYLWRYGGELSWTLSYEEFSRGVRSMNYVPPIIIEEDHWHRFVVEKKFASLEHDTWRIGRKGFLGLMKTAIRRNQMRKLNRAMQGERISWENTTLRSMWMGTAALLREDQELASTQRPSNRKGRRSTKLAEAGRPNGDMKERDPVNHVLTTLLSSLHNMESRIVVLEKNFQEKPRAGGADRGDAVCSSARAGDGASRSISAASKLSGRFSSRTSPAVMIDSAEIRCTENKQEPQQDVEAATNSPTAGTAGVLLPSMPAFGAMGFRMQLSNAGGGEALDALSGSLVRGFASLGDQVTDTLKGARNLASDAGNLRTAA